MAQAAYTVYVIRLLVMVPLTGAFVAAYNRMHGADGTTRMVEFVPNSAVSATSL